MSPSVRRPLSVPSSDCPQWYAVQVQSGREETVKQALERRARTEGMEGAVGRVIIPVERVAETRNGRRVERTRKLFPGYLVCEVVLDDQVLALIREMAGVIDFVRSGPIPVPLNQTEVERLLAGQSSEHVNVIAPDFDPGDRVRILRGAFAQTEGEVAEVLPGSGQIRVRVTILGRPVLLEMEASEILKLDRN